MGRRGSVLVVDDDPDVREVMSLALESSGYEARVAADGRDALAKLADGRPCVMLVDLMMPVMDGIELVRHLRREASTATIPIVIVSAFERPSGLAGANEFLSKPVDLGDLLDVVARFCSTTGA